MARFMLVTESVTLTTSQSWPVPANLYGTTIRAQVWGSTSGSGGATSSSASTGGGSGGAGYGEEPALAVTPGGTVAIVIPAGGNGGSGAAGISGTNPGDTTATGDLVTVTAHPGLPGTCSTGSGALGVGAPASGNTIAFAGGNGSSGVTGSHGGAGGGSAGSQGPGGNASGNTGGTAGTPDGAAGPSGPTLNGTGTAGANPGGGASGAHGGATHPGAKGGTGQATLTFQVMVPLGAAPAEGHSGLHKGGEADSAGAPVVPPPPPAVSPFDEPEGAEKGGTQLHHGTTAHGKGAPRVAPGPVHVAPFRQPTGAEHGARQLHHGTTAHAGGAPVRPFPAQVVNQWAAKVAQSPVWGTSLPGIASCNVDLIPANSVGGGTGKPTQGNWLFTVAGWNAGAGPATVSVCDDTHHWWRPAPPSPAAGGSRTVTWYQPNITAPTTVYVAPSAFTDGMSVTVIEVAGLGPWDTVTGISYGSVAGVAMGMSLLAPSGPAFMIAAVTGDSVAAGTALAAAGWTALAPVTATNGTDATGDTVLLTAAISTSAAQTVTGSASSAENLSGMMIGVLSAAPSPVPGGGNTSWPYLLFEAAFGAGYLTPADAMTWVNLQSIAAGMRLREWSDSAGIQYELDALESSEGESLLDNPDAALSPFNAASPYYPNVVPGTPVRIRAVCPGENRWRVITRNVEQWPQTWDEMFRGKTNTVITDLWSVINKELPTAYRAELISDLSAAGGGWWWPCDDPATNNPVQLINAAPGSATPLQITTAPGGLTSSVSIPVGSGTAVFLFSAIQALSADGGWMYGDSNSAAWSQTGTGSVSTGRYLHATDTFPSLATGATIGGWWNYTFQLTVPPNPTLTANGPPGQPSGTIVLWSADGPGGNLAQLFLDTSGHLRFTIGGVTTTIWAGSDLRNTTWFGVMATIGGGKWAVWLNGGVVAHVTGTTSVTGTWTDFYANAAAGGLSGIGNPEVSHLLILPVALPAARVIAHATGAYTAFGQMPQPTGLTQAFIPSTGYAPDGNRHTGTFFVPPVSFATGNNTLAALVTGTGGALTSGPVVPESWAYCQTTDSEPGDYAWLTVTGQAAPTFTWYTAAGSGAELAAATTVENYLFANSYGSGAAVPAAPSPAGDTVQNRLERILQAGGVTTPARGIDAAPAAVVAELDTGGQASGANLSNIAASDGGLLFMASDGNLKYFGRPRLTAQPVLWQLGPNVAAGQIPYQFEADQAGLNTDPQRVENDIAITQFDVTGAGTGAASGSGETRGVLVFAPDASRYAAVQASQRQNGPCPAKFTSYLQSQALIQSQVNWRFDNFGTPVLRIANLTVRAEAQSVSCPAAWQFVLGANPGDVAQVFFTPPGQPAFSGVWRITKISGRKLRFGADNTEASVTVTADFYPPGGEFS